MHFFLRIFLFSGNFCLSCRKILVFAFARISALAPIGRFYHHLIQVFGFLYVFFLHLIWVFFAFLEMWLFAIVSNKKAGTICGNSSPKCHLCPSMTPTCCVRVLVMKGETVFRFRVFVTDQRSQISFWIILFSSKYI